MSSPINPTAMPSALVDPAAGNATTMTYVNVLLPHPAAPVEARPTETHRFAPSARSASHA